MTQSKTPVSAAQAIRPHLPELLDLETAQAIDNQLEILLAQAESGQSIENQITETLRQYQPTQTWTKRYLKGENPDLITRSLQSPAGNPSDIPPPKDNEPPFVGMPPTPPSQK
jgi:hypothetical protein